MVTKKKKSKQQRSYNERAVAALGESIAELREERGMERSALATKAGVHYDAIARIERGERSPNVSTLARIADALEVKLSSLLEW